MESKVVETRCSKVWLDAFGIMHEEVFPNSDISQNDAKMAMEAVYQLQNRETHPILVDMRQIGSITREARIQYTDPELTKIINAAALLVHSPISRLLGNVMFRLHAKSVLRPMRMFTAEEEALSWLKGFVNEK